MYKFTIMLLAVSMLLVVVTQSGLAQQRVRLRVKMGDNDQVQAAAKYEERGTRRKFNVEVEDAAANTTFAVTVSRGGSTIYSGSLVTNGLGVGVIDIDTTEGGSVPSMQSGDQVSVSGGGANLQGTF